jgi:hypothetical protein
MTDRGQVTLLFVCITLLFLVPTPALGATPTKVTIEMGLAQLIEITEAESLVTLTEDLCSSRVARSTTSRTYSIHINWSESLQWRGSLFPGSESIPPSVDIPDWKMYSSDGSSSTCSNRVTGARAAKVLHHHGVEMQLLLSSSPTSPSPSGEGRNPLAFVTVLSAALLALVVGILVAKRLTRSSVR